MNSTAPTPSPAPANSSAKPETIAVQVTDQKLANQSVNGTQKKLDAASLAKQVKDNSENPYDKQFDIDLQKMEEDPIVFKQEEENKKLNETNSTILSENSKNSSRQ